MRSYKEFISDKLSVVDIKAKDRQGQIYQVEIQLSMFGYLPARAVYNWADIFSKQIKSGKNYYKLKPTYSIWLMAENIVKGDDNYVHEYKLRDKNGQGLFNHGGIWILELKKFRANTIKSDEQIWLQFFKEGETLDENKLPDWMNTNEMRQAMKTLRQFSEKEKNYHTYQARQNYLREQSSIQFEMEQNKQQKEAAVKREEAAVKREEAERKKKEAAVKREEVAVQREEAAVQRAEAAMKEKEAAMQKAEAAMQKAEAAMQKAEAALQENELLKAKLGLRV